MPLSRVEKTESAVEPFKDLGRRLSNWNRWGGDDQRGTLNLITPAAIAAAARLVQAGRSIALGLPLIAPQGEPVQGRRVRATRLMSTLHHESAFADGAGFSDDVLFMPAHGGTHWDALAHCSYDGLMYNGVPIATVTASGGASRLGIDQGAGGIVGRGVLLDVAALKGVECLPAAYPITPADLDAAAAREGVTVGAADILLVRTGRRRTAVDARALHRTSSDRGDGGFVLPPEPGLSQHCCAWLREKDVAAVASDNHAVEVLPPEDRRATLPLHCVLLRDMGMMLGERFDLEAIAADCRADGRWEFLFTAHPLNIPGATGSPTNPIAIK
jgi:kynurenine formamidase